MIQAIIFDCFGVLFTDNWATFQQKYLAARPVANRRAAELNRRSDLGLMSYDEWVAGMAVLTGLSETAVRHERHQGVGNDELLRYINTQLHPQYKTAVLSNVGRGFHQDLFRSWHGDVFDEVVLSFQVGATKPDGSVFITTADKLRVMPEACVFVDDTRANVDAAQSLGMQAIHYEDFRSFQFEIERILAIANKGA